MSDTMAAALYFARRRQRERARAQVLELTASRVANDAANGTEIGAFNVRNGTGTYTFTLTDDAGGLFAVDGAKLEKADTLAAGTAYIIEASADNGVDDAIVREFRVVAI